ncbi:hypothetical protein GF336_01490 [Candidatus Woesearchaeota archaeon]|nr:hypothetical protein [Candidatus Woesearchaeota archaeon]
MSTKTLTIMEDAYNILIENKKEGESFSEEIRRLLSKKKSKKLIDFFGILDKKTGDAMVNDYRKIRKEQIKLTKKRIKELG